jgi:hypothetical protein
LAINELEPLFNRQSMSQRAHHFNLMRLHYLFKTLFSNWCTTNFNLSLLAICNKKALTFNLCVFLTYCSLVHKIFLIELDSDEEFEIIAKLAMEEEISTSIGHSKQCRKFIWHDRLQAHKDILHDYLAK